MSLSDLGRPRFAERLFTVGSAVLFVSLMGAVVWAIRLAHI
ncbi:MAG: hypothetical protein ACREEB_06830 [Caulobacteraceae bacterium]